MPPAPEQYKHIGKTYDAFILIELPSDNSIPIRYFPPISNEAGSYGGKDGVIVKVTPYSTDNPWVGMFAFGGYNLNQISEMPDPEKLLVISGGTGYIISAVDPSNWETLKPFPILGCYHLPNTEVLLLHNFNTLYAYGPNGLLWQSDVADDGLRVIEITNECIIMIGTDCGYSRMFILNSDNGQLADSSLYELKNHINDINQVQLIGFGENHNNSKVFRQMIIFNLNWLKSQGFETLVVELTAKNKDIIEQYMKQNPIYLNSLPLYLEKELIEMIMLADDIGMSVIYANNDISDWEKREQFIWNELEKALDISKVVYWGGLAHTYTRKFDYLKNNHAQSTYSTAFNLAAQKIGREKIVTIAYGDKNFEINLPHSRSVLLNKRPILIDPRNLEPHYPGNNNNIDKYHNEQFAIPIKESENKVSLTIGDWDLIFFAKESENRSTHDLTPEK